MEYEHKGVQIAFDATKAVFSASIGGKFKRSASLPAIKKAIDTHMASEFKPFTALTDPPWHDRKKAPYAVVTVTAVEKGRGKYGSSAMDHWALSNGTKVRSVAVDTPENRKRIEDYAALKEKHRREKETMDSLELDADNAIVRISPEDK